MKRLFSLAVAAFACFATVSHAAPIGWSFSSDNPFGNVSGSFLFDANTMTFSDLDITVSPTSGSPIDVNNLYYATGSGFTSLSTPTPTDGGIFVNVANFQPPHTNAGGSVQGIVGYFPCIIADPSVITNGCRDSGFGANELTTFTSFTPSDVPLPASSVLLLGGLAGFGVLRRRRKATRPAPKLA